MNLKHIPLEGAYNFRDLGGYPTNDQRYTRWGKLYRSDSLSGLTHNDWEVIKKLNIKTIIDLRGTSEVSSAGINKPEDIKYYNISLMKDLDGMGDFRKLAFKNSNSNIKILESMILNYGNIIFSNLEGCVDVLNTIIQEINNGSIVFICSAGKDRTGIIAALILYLSDVIREDIIADYIVSSTYNTHGINKKLNSVPDEILKIIPNPEVLKEYLDSKPKTMIDFLDVLDSKDIRNVLDNEGFSRKLQNTFKDLFTSPIF